MQTIVVIPTYNECENLSPLITQLLSLNDSLDVLVVDDNSPDGTGRLADALAAACPRVHALHRPEKQGLASAYVAGFSFALAHGYDRVVEMDADFSHRPQDLPRLLAATEQADVAIGSRNVSGGQAVNWSPLRHLVSKGGSAFARAALGLPIKDCTSGFKVFRRDALERLDLTAVCTHGYGFQVELNHACHRAGVRLVEVPIVFPDRARGRSKMSWRIVLEAAILVTRLSLRLFWERLRYSGTPARRAQVARLPASGGTSA
jgi:dolichol-phosphate mannosyltransferase